MRKASLALVVVGIAIIGMGAQGCDPRLLDEISARNNWTSWYSGWLDEGYYIYFTFTAYSSLSGYVNISGYRDINSVYMRALLIPSEDFPRWKEGKPVRVVMETKNWGQGDHVSGLLLWATGLYGTYTLIIENQHIFDFVSGDAYIEVRGSYQ